MRKLARRLVLLPVLASSAVGPACGSSKSSQDAGTEVGVLMAAVLVGAIIEGLSDDDRPLFEKAPRWNLLSGRENVSSDPRLSFVPLDVSEPGDNRIVVVFDVTNGREAPLVLGQDSPVLLDSRDQPVTLLRQPATSIAPGASRKVAYTFQSKKTKGVFDLRIRLSDTTAVGPVVFQKKRP